MKSGMLKLGTKRVRFTPNGINLGLFQIRLVTFGDNLTDFGQKSDIHHWTALDYNFKLQHQQRIAKCGNY